MEFCFCFYVIYISQFNLLSYNFNAFFNFYVSANFLQILLVTYYSISYQPKNGFIEFYAEKTTDDGLGRIFKLVLASAGLATLFTFIVVSGIQFATKITIYFMIFALTGLFLFGMITFG